ncbi:nucleoside monophosphate kinase, partial [bacterium]|nr:nucleoside monophosphate kinase [bacterium]
VLFDVPDTVIVRRLSNRRSCPVCGAIYNLLTVPPKREGVCDHDGTKLVKRPDDDHETIRRRLQVYRRETSPLVDYYRGRGKLVLVDGIGGVEEVYQRLLNALARFEEC